MCRSFFSFLVFIFISIMTFMISNFSIKYIKSLDPIMIEIKRNSYIYEYESTNAFLNDNTIIPGISGNVVDLDNSFKVMKNYGAYNESLLVFSKVNPKVSVSNIYDKYVVSGNQIKKEVTFLFPVRDTNYLEEIIFILHKNNVIGTFFVEHEIFLESFDILKLMYLNNQNIEYLGGNNLYTNYGINSFSYVLKSYFGRSIKYCYTSGYNREVLGVCSKNKIHTIIPGLVIDKYPYHSISNNLNNGLIISFNNCEFLLDELNYIITYIRQKGYEIVSLERLLEE